MIIGISGLAGSGKDTAADFLVRDHGFVKVAFADEMKRTCMRVYKFSFEQLWGPSAMRNAPDKRYPREHGPFDDNRCRCCGELRESKEQCYLTPRFALQQLGSEWGRVCYEDTWIEYAVDIAAKLSDEGGYNYPEIHGLSHDWRPGDKNWVTSVVVPDLRFENELMGLDCICARTIRVKRLNAGLKGATGAHRSEQEQGGIPDSRFDYVLENNGTLRDLQELIRIAVHDWRQKGE